MTILGSCACGHSHHRPSDDDGKDYVCSYTNFNNKGLTSISMLIAENCCYAKLPQLSNFLHVDIYCTLVFFCCLVVYIIDYHQNQLQKARVDFRGTVVCRLPVILPFIQPSEALAGGKYCYMIRYKDGTQRCFTCRGREQYATNATGHLSLVGVTGDIKHCLHPCALLVYCSHDFSVTLVSGFCVHIY